MDDLVSKTRRSASRNICAAAFEQEAEAFLNTPLITFSRPLNEVIGQFSEKFEELKAQVTSRLLEFIRSEGLSRQSLIS